VWLRVPTVVTKEITAFCDMTSCLSANILKKQVSYPRRHSSSLKSTYPVAVRLLTGNLNTTCTHCQHQGSQPTDLFWFPAETFHFTMLNTIFAGWQVFWVPISEPWWQKSVTETLGCLNHLMWLSAWEYFTEFSNSESFKMYMMYVLDRTRYYLSCARYSWS
jgi:hypothetical protein